MTSKQLRSGFTLIELMAVVTIILVLTVVTALTFANARPSIKVKRDAAQMVSFLRTMWDRTKATGDPLILEPDFGGAVLGHIDPRDGKRVLAEFDSKARIVAIKLNDRLYSKRSDSGGDIYIAEGRGLSLVGVLFGLPGSDEDLLSEYEYLTYCKLNLITGKGTVEELDNEALEALFTEAEQAEVNRELEP